VQPENTPSEEWPTRVSSTDVLPGPTTIVRSEPVYPPTGPPVAAQELDRAIGRGLLLALVAVALVAIAALAAWYLTHRPNNGASTVTTTTTAAPATGAGSISVPALAGRDETAALVALGKVGLRPKLEQRTAGPADGRVVSQRPAANSKVALGAPVTLVVDRPNPHVAAANPSKPKVATTTTAQPTPQPATVPDLSGKNEQGAAQALYDAGVAPSIVFVPANDPLGTVEGQAKPAGTELPARSTMEITISRGQGQNPGETVPDVAGKTLPDAVSTVNGQQLRLIYLKQPVTDQAQAGTIVKQTPSAGAHAPRNGQVLVYLGAFRPNG
jgi:beta-lactam-binding protein with PASTA domain